MDPRVRGIQINSDLAHVNIRGSETPGQPIYIVLKVNVPKSNFNTPFSLLPARYTSPLYSVEYPIPIEQGKLGVGLHVFWYKL